MILLVQDFYGIIQFHMTKYAVNARIVIEIISILSPLEKFIIFYTNMSVCTY